MSTDRELLELAAKAAGIQLDSCGENGGWYWPDGKDGAAMPIPWNPLGLDGDALRLAVKLGIKVRWHAVLNQALAWLPLGDEIQVNGEDCGGDQFAATRRAIVRAAVEIGRAMP